MERSKFVMFELSPLKDKPDRIKIKTMNEV